MLKAKLDVPLARVFVKIQLTFWGETHAFLQVSFIYHFTSDASEVKLPVQFSSVQPYS